MRRLINEGRYDKDEVKKREVHECDVRTRDPDAMVDPPTPKPTFKSEALTREKHVWKPSLSRVPVCESFFVLFIIRVE
jgi:hypothetical protein